MTTIKNYIVVDDDPWNNKICTFNLKKALGDVHIHSFQLPEKGLDFIENEFKNNIQPTILFLDINMPEINGWQFLERYEKLSDEIKKSITIYMLSSSINHADIEKAKASQYVKDFISKPLLNDAIVMVANNNVTAKLNHF